MAATPEHPVAAWRARYGCIRSSLPPRSSLPNFTQGMSLNSANVATARRNCWPILLNNAGEGTG
jgi:hypothetical protein